MKYLDPKADLTFKKIFGNHPARLISLLNALLPLSEEEQIHEIKYLPTELVPQLEGDKNTIVDVLCTDARGRIIPQPANCGLGDLHYVIERVMNVYQPVFPLFIWSFQEKSVILRRN